MNENYKYDGDNLSAQAVAEILQHRFGTFRWIYNNAQGIIDEICNFHEEKGGLLTEGDNRKDMIEQVLIELSGFGKASNFEPYRWYISRPDQRVLGKGQNCVYLYYISSQKKEDAEYYPCTIGQTSKDITEVTEYIERQTKKAVVERPKIALIFQTDHSLALERAIQKTLEVRGRHIKHAPGNEIYNTNPEEVLNIYDFVVHNQPDYTKKKEFLFNRRFRRNKGVSKDVR